MSERVIGDDTIEALFAELNKASKGDDGLTTAEIATKLKVGHRRAQALLRQAFTDGRLVVGTRPFMRFDGRPTRVAVYRITPVKKRK